MDRTRVEQAFTSERSLEREVQVRPDSLSDQEFMMSLLRDLKIAVRYLLKSPGFTATAVLMLALGVGATTAIFSIVEGVLLRPLPFPQSERLMQVSDILQGADVGGNGEAGVTAPDIQAYTRDTHSFDSLGGYTQTGYELSGI